MFGKRDLAQLNSHDLLVMLLVSNVVQNAIIGPDPNLLGGIISAVTLFVFRRHVDARLDAIERVIARPSTP
ncbi:hypothetical protein AB1484_28825 [Parafrankia sp. FMc6]|uniref:hypothetical protein n=1 Tax=Parafrankia soli TaxID=2599596 RepID=UPI0034D70770